MRGRGAVLGGRWSGDGTALLTCEEGEGVEGEGGRRGREGGRGAVLGGRWSGDGTALLTCEEGEGVEGVGGRGGRGRKGEGGGGGRERGSVRREVEWGRNCFAYM